MMLITNELIMFPWLFEWIARKHFLKIEKHHEFTLILPVRMGRDICLAT